MRQQIMRLIAIVGLIILGAVVWQHSPLWPGPALPPHATRLHIVTEALRLLPTPGCPTALLGPVRVATTGSDLVVISVETGEPVPVVWPGGWAAWRLGERAELVDRSGSIVAREGDVIADRFGGGEYGDSVFHVCMGGW